jgi:hypothetical protein
VKKELDLCPSDKRDLNVEDDNLGNEDGNKWARCLWVTQDRSNARKPVRNGSKGQSASHFKWFGSIPLRYNVTLDPAAAHGLRSSSTSTTGRIHGSTRNRNGRTYIERKRFRYREGRSVVHPLERSRCSHDRPIRCRMLGLSARERR